MIARIQFKSSIGGSRDEALENFPNDHDNLSFDRFSILMAEAHIGGGSRKGCDPSLIFSSLDILT